VKSIPAESTAGVKPMRRWTAFDFPTVTWPYVLHNHRVPDTHDIAVLIADAAELVIRPGKTSA
jgi:hypothetical protein